MRRLGRYAEAHSALDEALKLDGHYNFALNTKGIIFEAEGKLSDALTYCEKAIQAKSWK